MREVKYRAWDKENKKMIHHPICFEAGTFTDHVGLNDLLKTFIIRGFILLEYTGLKDCKGKEIYEGDVVKYKLETSGYESLHTVGVVFLNGRFSPLPINEECEDSWYSVSIKDYEVIGTIYENPELLENKK